MSSEPSTSQRNVKIDDNVKNNGDKTTTVWWGVHDHLDEKGDSHNIIKTATVASLRHDLARLEYQEQELLYKKKLVDEHITALHGYNEIKDITQMLMGKLAEMDRSGVITKDLYPEYGLELTD